MDFRCGGTAGGNGDGGHNDNEQGSEGSHQLKRKMSDLEASMKAMKDAVVKENAEKSAKIRRLMEQNVRLKETVFRLENPTFPVGPIRGAPLQNPFLVFPKVVWESIIEKMNRSSDLEMLCLAFPQLEGLVMERKKTIVLFKNVFPLICNRLVLEDMKNCRLVCGTWNEVVCALVENWISPNLLPNDPLLTNNEIFTKTPLPDIQSVRLNGILAFMLRRAYRFRNHEKIENFLIKMADHPGNPLVGRLLSFDVDYQTELEQFWNSALELVRKFGEHVWNLEINCYWGGYHDHNQIDFYKAVQKALIHLPNLKYLYVDYNFTGEGPSKVDMAVEIRNFPLPPLPYLQSFNLALNGEPGMSNAFSTYFSSQIRHLVLKKNSFANLTDDSLRGLLNLNKLEVELQTKEDMSRLLKFPYPENLNELRPHATSYSTDPRKPPVSFAPEQFASLLERFSRLDGRLDITRCQVDLSSFLTSRERFSGLTTLQISVGIGEDEREHNLDFLLWFQSMKHLVIQILFMGRTGTPFEEYDQHSTLKIRNYLFHGRMLESNIWTLMPSLQLLECRGKFRAQGEILPPGNGIYTREMYENRVG